MEKKIKILITAYESLIEYCDSEIKKQYSTRTLEIYIKGKKEAYERIVEDLENLLK